MRFVKEDVKNAGSHAKKLKFFLREGGVFYVFLDREGSCRLPPVGKERRIEAWGRGNLRFRRTMV